MPYTVLIVDDEQDIRELIADVLEDEGYKTKQAGSAASALSSLESAALPDAVVLDVWLQDSDQDGLAVLQFIKKHYPDIPVIMISGHASIETAIQAIRIGAFDFVEKPFKEQHLLHRLDHAFRTKKLKQDNVSLRQTGHHEDFLLVGNSPALMKLKKDVERIAPSDSRVIIHGPPGCGKTVAAYALHSASPRAKGPFLTLNTALMTEENAETFLCGGYHDKDRPVRSVFEQAHGGTLFIDEIADIPVSAQRKMLKIVQQGYVESPLAEGDKVYFSTRIMAGAKRNLDLEMRAGRLRKDLYYRIGVEELSVPSLRERISDLEALTTYFMEQSAKRHGIPPRKLTSNALAALAAYSWPGDVRELRNLIERLLINAPGHSSVPISSSMLPPDIVAGGHPPSMSIHGASVVKPQNSFSKQQAADQPNVMALPLREAREAFEKHYLSAQIRRFNNNISKTAEFIGMERSALYRKLKLLNLYEGVQKQRDEEPEPERSVVEEARA